jgi:hypothetical protein
MWYSSFISKIVRTTTTMNPITTVIVIEERQINSKQISSRYGKQGRMAFLEEWAPYEVF